VTEPARNDEPGFGSDVALENLAVVTIWTAQSFVRPACSPKFPAVPTSRLISGFGRENGSVETPSSSALIIANMTRDLRLPKTLGRDRRE
jgi:hypothetical protein